LKGRDAKPGPFHTLGESMGDASIRILGGFHGAVRHHELQKALRAVPKFQAMLDKNNGAYYYTMVRRLVKGGKVKKAGKGKIRLVRKDETPSGFPSEGVSKATTEG
jgi:hypothetical protein